MEGIVNIRVDDRLIHGQVAAFWTNTLNASRIMVIDDAIANDETEKALLRMVAPSTVKTSIISKETAATNIKAGKYAAQRVFVLVKSPVTLLTLLDMGVNITAINIGNMAKRDDTRQIKPSISLSAAEENAIRELLARNITIYAQMVPDHPQIPIQEFLDK